MHAGTRAPSPASPAQLRSNATHACWRHVCVCHGACPHAAWLVCSTLQALRRVGTLSTLSSSCLHVRGDDVPPPPPVRLCTACSPLLRRAGGAMTHSLTHSHGGDQACPFAGRAAGHPVQVGRGARPAAHLPALPPLLLPPARPLRAPGLPHARHGRGQGAAAGRRAG